MPNFVAQRRVKRNSKPRVGAGKLRQKYNNDVLVAYYFKEGGGKIAHDTSLNKRNGVINGATWVSTIAGLGLSHDGINDTTVFPGHQLTRFTIEIVGVVSSVGATSNIFSMAESPGSSTVDRSLYLTAGSELRFRIYDGATKTVTSGLIMSVGDVYYAACTSDGTAITITVSRASDYDVASALAGDAYTGFASPEFIIGRGHDDSGTGNFGGPTVVFVQHTPRVLSQHEIRSRSLNYLSRLAPRTRTIFTPSAAPAAGNPWYYYVQQQGFDHVG